MFAQPYASSFYTKVQSVILRKVCENNKSFVSDVAIAATATGHFPALKEWQLSFHVKLRG